VGAPIILLWGVDRSGGNKADTTPVKLGMASRP
jgi:hypothetical protein